MNNLKTEFQNFMGCMIEDTLSTLKAENIEYGKCRENERNNMKKSERF